VLIKRIFFDKNKRMSEKAPSKKSLIFLMIAIGFCCLISVVVAGIYLVYKKEKADRVNMDGDWLNRDSKALEFKIEDDDGDYITVKNPDATLDVTLKVNGRAPLEATYSKEDPADPIPDQEPVRTHIKTVYSLTSKDGKTAEFKTRIYDKYEDGTKSVEEDETLVKLIKEGEDEEEFRVVRNVNHPPRRRCKCSNHKYSPYPNMW
jgi:hypothetical protein